MVSDRRTSDIDGDFRAVNGVGYTVILASITAFYPGDPEFCIPEKCNFCCYTQVGSSVPGDADGPWDSTY